MDQSHIRNFCIIAHIDHGKSTLADRMLELTGTIPKRQMAEQVLDQMDLERERGITIKAATVSFPYRAQDGQIYLLNLVDCPGHVDFTYEVSKSLKAAEGALLIIDAAQGIQAQTLANYYLALDHDLVMIPVLNKIDLPEADPDRVALEVEAELGLPAEGALRISAKAGIGIEAVLEEIVARIPAPQGDASAPLSALIYDVDYDSFKGVAPTVRVFDGCLKPGMTVRFMGKAKDFQVETVGVFSPKPVPVEALHPGQVGFFTAQIKDIRQVGLGDTVTQAGRPCAAPIPGYRPLKPVVFCGLYPTTESEFSEVRVALEKLSVNDSSFSFEEEHSEALGRGYRVGFMGLLHRDIIQERLEREYQLALIATTPSVAYHVYTVKGERLVIENPSKFPASGEIERVEEPVVDITVITPDRYLGGILELLESRRGQHVDMRFLGEGRVVLRYHVPLGEIALDFYDQLKARSQGYASLDYEPLGYHASDLVKLEVLVNHQQVDALCCIVHKDQAYRMGKRLVERLKEEIPRAQFPIPLQAALGRRVIARETIPAFRKDVTAKLYGGDVTRKMKLLEKQKAGKRRMKTVGQVSIPQTAFLSLLERD
ncbi:MAG TPA: translation elongation factor 4 [Candidatus Bipolaricaulota bacterium]